MNPTLVELQPGQARPGDTVQVTAYGGYLYDGQGGYIESSRSFALFFDGRQFGEIVCYVNYCGGILIIPADAAPGTHTVATEGGSSLELHVTVA